MINTIHSFSYTKSMAFCYSVYAFNSNRCYNVFTYIYFWVPALLWINSCILVMGLCGKMS